MADRSRNAMTLYPVLPSLGLNALAANTVEDVLRRPLQNLKEGTVTLITKLTVTAYGVLIIGLSYFTTFLQGSIIQMAITVVGAFGSPILGIFVMGASVPWANKFGALAGAAVSLSFNLWISLGRRLYGSPPQTLPSISTTGCSALVALSNTTDEILESKKNISDVLFFHSTIVNDTGVVNATQEMSDPNVFLLYRISHEWYSTLGTLVCIAVGLLVSYITNCLVLYRRDESPSERVLSARYTFPFLRKFWKMDYREIDVYCASYAEATVVKSAHGSEEQDILYTEERQLTEI
ncbi:sodium-coupled monocarboxylate transporter 2 [Elysia marginata]|uniref:Sodium-coupled monocarboxylate transporter 2 n=1 Tax=Elysia marginata TaxID=1093978 RepID=A0AAV4FLR8_9GAST|nr:sodium-coupled monocarboxylate transporter 2 [Elysia marginata]